MTTRQKITLAVSDFFLVWLGLLIALGLRVDFNPESMARFTRDPVWFLAISSTCVVSFHLFGLYDRFWRYAGIRELIEVAAASTVALFPFEVLALWGEGFAFPRTALLLAWFVVVAEVGGLRLLLRLASERVANEPHRKPVLVVGANDAGESVLRDLGRAGSGFAVVGFVAVEKEPKGSIRGVPIVGRLEELPGLIGEMRVEELILAQLSPARSSQVVRLCEGLEVALKTVPAATALVSGQVQVNPLRELRIEDLLEREPVSLDPGPVKTYLAGKTVLVTGAGGSIGSEICRQVLGFGPRLVILLGRGENSIHELMVELNGQAVVPVICDVRNPRGLEEVFRQHRPQVVFHAAAHKHVPLMERVTAEAVANNVFGSLNVMDLCKQYEAEKFILLSSDKAVNPTSVMGATKRLAELLLAKNPGNGFAAVRFGNVLGSRGSVVPTFRSQIEKGGPVTVTDPEMTRFFMTIPEAVALVLQAGSLAEGGEIYVLDMGKQVKIVDLARNLIRLSGFEPERDIPIEIIGVRQGEKMYEELVNVGEEVDDTALPKIQKVVSPPPSGDWPGPKLDRLRQSTEEADHDAALDGLAELVKNFHPVSSSESEVGALT